MEVILNMSICTLLFLLFSIYISPNMAQIPGANGRATYIVHVLREPSMASLSTSEDLDQWYRSFLPATTASSGQPSLVYSYSSVVSGFAARLTNEELEAVKKKTGFIHAIPDRLLHLKTTYSPSFLGLLPSSPGFWNTSNYGTGVIIGVLDSGVTPDHPSFSDDDVPPPPTKWKGVCEFESGSSCNNKLIGAMTLLSGMKAMRSEVQQTRPMAEGPVDIDGHGTHTASTAAGMFVKNANINGLANGTAAGMAPYAHLAIYKVCDDDVCAGSDVLAGIDQAVKDGVDIISASLGAGSLNFYEDTSAIGSFGATEKGVFVSFAGGNEGPSYSTLSNDAPWVITVGASTMDRNLQTTVKLGTGDVIKGQSAYQPEGFKSTPLSLVYPGSTVSAAAAICTNDSLDGVDVKGMMVVCDEGNITEVEKGQNVKAAGGAAMIIANVQIEGYTTTARPHVLPVAHVSYADGVTIKSYISTASAPTATIVFDGTLFGVTPSPAITYFSSRGPSGADPYVLKPDIIGPGADILAAWPSSAGPGLSVGADFNMISGTSMATPHISGIAALLKSAHPDWSPAAIKSAMMTSAEITGNDGNLIADYTLDSADFFAMGSGHVNPTKANTPGFVYDIEPESYIPYLCGLGYTNRQISAVVRRSIDCSESSPITGSELNYPSFMVFLTKSNDYAVTVNRTVTNVGDAASSYTVKVTEPSGASVSVKPKTISFSSANELAEFSVTFSSSTGGTGKTSYSQGYLTWASSEGNITVRSPIMVGVA